MKYEDLAKVNSALNKVDIKGKKYVEVSERIKGFRQLYPNGRITTDIVSHNDGIVVIKATAYDEQGNVLATGHAFENQNWGLINKTNYIENCETSAVGRALGMLGIGDTDIASADEMRFFEDKQTGANGKLAKVNTTLRADMPSDFLDRIIILKDTYNANLENLCIAYNKHDINDMTIEELDKAIERKQKQAEGK